MAAAFWPELQVAPSGGLVTMAWPAEYSASILERRATFVCGWTVVTNVPALINNTTWTVTLPAGIASGVYRLRLE